MCIFIIFAVHGKYITAPIMQDNTTAKATSACDYEPVEFPGLPEIKLPAVSADSIGLLTKSIETMTTEESQATAKYFPWEDVLACMKDGRVFYSEEKGDCGERLIAVNFYSPRWTWEKLCGRSGLLYICPVCKRQVKFDCRIMN